MLSLSSFEMKTFYYLIVISEHGVHYMFRIYSKHFPVLKWEITACDVCILFNSFRVTIVFLLIIGTVLIKSNSGQLMLVSPQQAVTGAKTTSNITPRPAVPANTQTVKICTVPVIYLNLSFQPLSSYQHVASKNLR